VLIAVTDKKLATRSTNGTTKLNYDSADIVSANDYYPFGMIMPARSYTVGSGYRYGFNGKENDNEAKTGYQSYGKREYDELSGRFISVDLITNQYPELSPYQFASNCPIFGIDRDGLELFGNMWLFDIWMEWKFGDSTGIKTLKSGIEEKAAVQTQQTSYHDNVPKAFEKQLDHVNNVQANLKIAAGVSKVAVFNIKTSFDIVSSVAPIGEGIAVSLKEAEIVYGGIRAERALVGSSDKIAVIGRDFDTRVLKFAEGFEKQTGTKVETFRASAGAKYSWGKLLEEYKGNVPDDIAKESLLYRENLAWAEKIKKEGYKVLDTGLGTKDGNGTFYGMETKTIFGEKK